MWMISADAGSLLSVVKFNAKKAPDMAKEAGVDPESEDVYCLVRARIKQSAEYLCDVLDAINAGELPGWKKPVVKSDKSADYQFRVVVTLDAWKQFLCFEADGITYDSHFKEALRDRAPEGTNKSGIYSAAMSTWTAWSKLQPNPPYGGYTGYGYGPKPDCRNCGHKEINHGISGGSCHIGRKYRWDAVAKKSEWLPDEKSTVPACPCEKWEPKYPDCAGCKHPEPEHENRKHQDGSTDEHCLRKDCDCQKYTQITPPPPAKSAKASAAVFSEGDTGVDEVYPASVYGSSWDVPLEGDEGEGGLDWNEVQFCEEDHAYHPIWCTIFDGDMCICTDPDEFEERYATGEPGASPVPEFGQGTHVDGVFQEAPVIGETAEQKKARVRRNRRARRRARKQAQADEKL